MIRYSIAIFILLVTAVTSNIKIAIEYLIIKLKIEDLY